MGTPEIVVKRALPSSSRFVPVGAPIGRSGAFSSAGCSVFSAHCFSPAEGVRPSKTSAIGDSTVVFFLSAMGGNAPGTTLNDRRCAETVGRRYLGPAAQFPRLRVFPTDVDGVV